LRKYIRQIPIWTNVVVACALFIAYLANYISPARFWVPAFFGLAYPFILLLNIGFVIFWLWRRKIYAIISFIIILAGFGNIGRFLQSGFFTKHITNLNEIKLLSYNVRIFNLYNWEKGGSKRDDIVNFVIRQKPDIVCFQEFLTREKQPGQSRRSMDIKLAQLPFGHVYYSVHGRNSTNYGIATYSKYPIVHRGILKFSNSFNACIYSDILAKGDTIRVFNVHLESIRLGSKDYNFMDSLLYDFNSNRFTEAKAISGRLKTAYIKRAHQVDALEKIVRNSPYPVIICGDFNDTPVSYTYQNVRGDLEDAYMESGEGIGSTYRGNFPSFRIDYIFHSKGFKAQNYITYPVKYSDHYPVSCEFDLK
jgi:endonuclease/exonuclease/phosphatase family metal-dependent hydrolase